MKFCIKSVILVIIIWLSFYTDIYSAPANLTRLYIKSNDITLDSTVVFVTIGDGFEIYADTDFPVWSGVPDYFYCSVTTSSNLNDTIYLKLYQEAGDTGLYKTNFEIVSIDKSNGQLKKIGVNNNSGETIYFSFNGIVYDTLIVSVSRPPLTVNTLNFYSNAAYSVIINDSGVPIETICYLEANAVDGSEYSIDSLPITVESKYDSFNINLIETGKNTGLYRGYIKVTNSTVPQNQYIKVLVSGDTVQIKESISNNTAIITYRQPSEPNTFYGIEFVIDNFSNQTKNDSLILESNAYIKLSANDPNQNILDLVRIIIKNIRTGDTITKILYEQSPGIYTGNFYLTTYTNGTIGYLGAYYGDSITVYNILDSISDTLQVAVPSGPAALNNLRFMNYSYLSELTGYIPASSQLYIEANGLDGNSLTVDTMECYVKSNLDNAGIIVVLTETEKNSGRYRGIVNTGNYSDTVSQVINSFNNGDTVGIYKTINGMTFYDEISIQNSVSPVIVNYLEFKTFVTLEVIEGEILPTDQIIVEAIAVDRNSNSIDTLNASIYSAINNDTIIFDLYETSRNSGVFRNSFELSQNYTNQTLKILKASFGDTITGYISDSTVINDVLKVTVPSPPTVINSLRFMEEFYQIEKGEYTDAYTKIYVEITATDNNPYYQDTKQAICYSTYDSITIILTETGKNNGVFRGFIELNNFTFETLNYIKAYKNGETVSVYCGNKYDTVTLFLTSSPISVISINIKESIDYLTNKTDLLTIGDNVFVEIIAVDANPLTKDTMTMRAQVTASDYIEFTAVETEKNSNRYRGFFRLTTLSNDTIDELGVNYGDTLRIIAAATNDSITANITIPMSPAFYNELIFTQADYNNAWLDINQVNFGYTVYIRMTASDFNPLTSDTFGVILYTLGQTGSDSVEYIYNLTLLETGKHTGIFQGNAVLDVVKSVAQNRCKTKQGTYIILVPGDTLAENVKNINSELINNAVDTLQTATPKPPTDFISATLKTDAFFTGIKYSPIIWNEFLFLEVEADKTTSSDLIEDTVIVMIQSTSEENFGDTGYFTLLETGIHTGVYRSGPRDIEISNIDEVGQQFYASRLEVKSGDWVTITALNPNTLSLSSTKIMREAAYIIPPKRIKTIRTYRNSSYNESSRVSNGLISFEPNYRYMYFEVEAYDLAGTLTDTTLYANDELEDTVELLITSRLGLNGLGGTVPITLIEKGKITYIYRNRLENPYIV
ncbi:hypothetical protein KA977_09285, partial [Candidatus Dependentiae bacterium]|nr:hypothetical protein [Candidatus Dependentiae bacterium]